MTSEIEVDYYPKTSVEADSGPYEQDLNRVYQALSHPTRRAILQVLAPEPQSVSQVVAHFTLAQPTISRHLAILLEAGLVSRQRRGQRVFYALDRTLMRQVSSIPLRTPQDRRSGRLTAPL